MAVRTKWVYAIIAVLCSLVLCTGEEGESKHDLALKNRAKAPAAADLDGAVTVEGLIAKNGAGDWSAKKGATVEGWVVQVEREHDGDIHVALAATAAQTDSVKWMIVEVTPAWQRRNPKLAEKRLHALVHKHVRVTGWLYWEPEAEQEDPRGTRWEIHPVTSIEVIP